MSAGFSLYYYYTLVDIERACDIILAEMPTVIALDTEGEVGTHAPRADVISLALGKKVYVLQLAPNFIAAPTVPNFINSTNESNFTTGNIATNGANELVTPPNLTHQSQVQMFSPRLSKILSSRSIIKVGLAIHGDIERLGRLGYTNIHHTLELQQLAAIKGYPLALDDLYHLLCPQELKLVAVQHHDVSGEKLAWTAKLSPELLHYAARDAQATLLVLQKLLLLTQPETAANIVAKIICSDPYSTTGLVSENDLTLFARWLMGHLSDRHKSAISLLAIIANSYGVLTSKYNKAKVMEIATDYLTRLVAAGVIEYDAAIQSYSSRANTFALSTTATLNQPIAPDPQSVPLPQKFLPLGQAMLTLTSRDIESITRLRFKSAVNYLTNSSKTFLPILTVMERQKQVALVIRKAIINGDLELINDVIYPKRAAAM